MDLSPSWNSSHIPDMHSKMGASHLWFVRRGSFIFFQLAVNDIIIHYFWVYQWKPVQVQLPEVDIPHGMG